MSGFSTIPPDATVVKTAGTDFSLHDGVVYAITKPNTPTRSLPEVAAGYEQLRELLGDNRRPFVFDLRNVAWVDAGARSFLHEHIDELATRVAFLVDRSKARAATYAVLGFEDPPVPMDMFSNEEDALAFVRQDIQSGCD